MINLGIIAAPCEHNSALYSEAFLLTEEETQALKAHLDSIPIKVSDETSTQALLPENLPIKFLPPGFISGKIRRTRRDDTARWGVDYSLEEKGLEKEVHPGDVFIYPKLGFLFNHQEDHAGVLLVTPFVQVLWSAAGDKPYPNNEILPGSSKWAFADILNRYFDEKYRGEGEKGVINSRWMIWDGINFAPLSSARYLFGELEHLARNLEPKDLGRVEMVRNQVYGFDSMFKHVSGSYDEYGLKRELKRSVKGIYMQAIDEIVERVSKAQRQPSKLLQLVEKQTVTA